MTNLPLDLRALRGVVFDMDGVLWRDSQVLPGAVEFLCFLRDHKIPFQLATNNSTANLSEYVQKCASLGLPVEASQITTSSLVLLDALRAKFPAGTPVYVIGSPSLAAIYTEAGYPIDADNAQAVIIGLDRLINYDKLKLAFRRLMAGAEFLATNADATFPASDGLAPGAGSLVAALERSSGRKARIMGKPEPAIFQGAVQRLGCDPHQALMVGDRLDTDIAGAQNAGLKAALVLTGVSRRADVGEINPDVTYETLSDLHNDWLAAIG